MLITVCLCELSPSVAFSARACLQVPHSTLDEFSGNTGFFIALLCGSLTGAHPVAATFLTVYLTFAIVSFEISKLKSKYHDNSTA